MTVTPEMIAFANGLADTSGKVMKPAKINTGFELPVAAFIEIGDKIEIDTRTNEFKKRVTG